LTKHQTPLLPDFANISYLQTGSALQQKGFHLLYDKKILYHLKAAQPVLVGTLPLNIFITGKSDLDILGRATDFKTVEKILLTNFSGFERFILEEKLVRQQPTLICRFQINTVPAELFIQNTPVKEQYGYRHMVIEHWLLTKYGEGFRKKIIELKRKGMKTEPAFAELLGLKGDPYESLLDFENDPEFGRYVDVGS
jgi:hypothetical protein